MMVMIILGDHVQTALESMELDEELELRETLCQTVIDKYLKENAGFIQNLEEAKRALQNEWKRVNEARNVIISAEKRSEISFQNAMVRLHPNLTYVTGAGGKELFGRRSTIF
jgi:hypothetical protein